METSFILSMVALGAAVVLFATLNLINLLQFAL